MWTDGSYIEEGWHWTTNLEALFVLFVQGWTIHKAALATVWRQLYYYYVPPPFHVANLFIHDDQTISLPWLHPTIGTLYAPCACMYICNICFHFVWYLQLSSKEAVQRVLKGEKPSETLGKEKKKRSVHGHAGCCTSTYM